MRSKEDARDYRYFPEPDLPPVRVDEAWLKEIKARQPEFREEKRKRYRKDYGISDYDAGILTETKAMADVFEKAAALSKLPKKAANWLMGETLRLQKEHHMEAKELPFSPEHLAELVLLTESGAINSTVAKEVFEEMFLHDVDPGRYVEEKGLRTLGDEGELRDCIYRILEENPKSVRDYLNGKDRALGFLVGQTMKATKGQADPEKVQQLLKEILQK